MQLTANKSQSWTHFVGRLAPSGSGSRIRRISVVFLNAAYQKSHLQELPLELFEGDLKICKSNFSGFGAPWCFNREPCPSLPWMKLILLIFIS